MNNIELNHQIYLQNRADSFLGKFLKIFYFFLPLIFNLIFFVGDLIFLIEEWDKFSFLSIKYWFLTITIYCFLSFILIIYKCIHDITFINIREFPLINFLNNISYSTFIGIYLCGWILYSKIYNDNASFIKKIMFIHLIFYSIVIGWMIFCITCLCGFLIYILSRIYNTNYNSDGNNSLNDQQIKNLTDYKYFDGQIIKMDIKNKKELVKLDLKINDRMCCICLNNYQNEELLRLFVCNHHFHKICCDTWLLKHNSCPLCRKAVLEDF
jgi:hypothetical protein